jgi:xanthine dehydrogenase accessory factor
MAVDPQTAPSASYDDQTYYFCSEGCRDQFVNDPASIVGNTGS